MALKRHRKPEMVGVLLITRRGADRRRQFQTISLVRASDFAVLEERLARQREMAAEVTRIRNQIAQTNTMVAELRRKGVSDKQLTKHGVDLGMLNPTIPDTTTRFLVVSYAIQHDALFGDDRLVYKERIEIDLGGIEQIELENQRPVAAYSPV